MAEASQAGAVAAPTERSWWPFAGAIALAIVVGLGLLGGYSVVVFKLRRSNSGKAAVAEIKSSTQLQRLLGEPLKVKIEGGELQHEGAASFEMRVAGPKGSAMVEVESRAENHVWHITDGKVILGSGSELPYEVIASHGVPPEAPAPHEQPPAP